MRTLLEGDAHPDPIRQFQLWFGEAEEAGLSLPHAMTLASVGPAGRPSIRSVLLQGVDQRGFVFYTSYRSRKATELGGNPWVALALRWVELEREVRIEGMAERVSADESDAYFRTRPREAQLAAWASPQSEVVASREELERRLAEADGRFQGQEVPRPPHWGGFRVGPELMEFWQGRPGRLHDRLRYLRQADGSWKMDRLAP